MNIDFVLLWVDDSDPAWQSEYQKYHQDAEGDARSVRFRDWDNLQFWFRSVEKFTPWVRKIHFVTHGHLPEWLNTSHPKLNIVRHADFIDAAYLPLFNSRAIEVNIHRIPGLADRFVYFNDDMFLNHPLDPSFFFMGGLPCDVFAYNAISPQNGLAVPMINNLRIISAYFSKPRLRFGKTLNIKYGVLNLRSMLLSPWPAMLGFYDPHQPTSLLKSTMEAVWAKKEKVLQDTTRTRFQNDSNVNQYLFRYWQLAEGNFYPRDPRTMRMIMARNRKDVDAACHEILRGKKSLLCINDESNIYDFDDAKRRIVEAFTQRHPDKSEFEI